MATQEPNVYAGLSVVVGGLMHARPRFFAKVMGELLFWVGEDKMLFGSDYAIWEPKWQIDGLLDWDYPDDTYSDYPRWTTEAKRRCSGLNAAKLYGIDGARGAAAAARRHARRPRRRPARGGRSVIEPQAQALAALAARHRPRARRADHRRWGSSARASCSDAGDVDVHLRLPTPQCAPNFAFLMAIRRARRRRAGCPGSARSASCSTTTTPARRSTPRWWAAARFAAAFPGEDDRRRWTSCASSSGARRCSPARVASATMLLPAGDGPGRCAWRCASPTCPIDAEVARCIDAARASSACPTTPTPRRSCAGDGSRDPGRGPDARGCAARGSSA